MSCSKIRKHLEAAEAEVRHALTASLENKHEENLTLLVDTLNNIKELLVTTPIRGVDNVTEHYRKNAEHNFTIPDPDGGVNTVDGYKFSLESDIDLNTGGYKVPADILQFPTTIPGADIKIDSTVSTTLASTNQVNLAGKAAMNVYGGLMEFADGATALLGSKNSDKLLAKAGKLSSVLEDTMRDLPASIEAAANELEKSGIAQKLETIVSSGELEEGLKETLSKSEEKLKEMSNKYGDFFKKNLT